MAHVAKFNRGALGHVLAVYDRSTDRLGDNIDPQRTCLNYNLAQADQPKKQLDYIHDRLKEVKLQNRKDVNVLCDWVVTAPKSLPEQELEPFFRACYAFLTGKYGTHNVVSAYVHMDEMTPHMHYAFIPVVPDKKHLGQEKVSAKEAITIFDLRTFHQDLQDYVESALGHDVGILNGATKDGNKAIAELKRGAALQTLAEANEEATRIISEAQEQSRAILAAAREEAEKIRAEATGFTGE